MSTLNNKRIILGITGGIAAYKSADLCRRLREMGATVQIVMTAAAKEFITKLTMQAVSGNPVHDDLLDPNAEAAMGHIELARWADLIIIAPASADFMAQLTHGLAKDLLSTLCLATKAPIAIAPAMNQQMWQSAITQANLALLRQRDFSIFGPTEGSQACGDVGMGRLLEPAEIVKQAEKLFVGGCLQNLRILITAGPTQEAIDPVRYISNHSSGKMGYALAQAAIEEGAVVTLVTGPVNLKTPDRVSGIQITSALEMYQAVLAEIKDQDIFIATAAVSDYRVSAVAEQKIKKNKENLHLTLVRNPDILATVTQMPVHPFSVGFAAETENVLPYAKQKLEEKKLDLIVANQVGLVDQGAGSDNNACVLLGPKGEQTFSLTSKAKLARQLIKEIARHYYEKYPTKNS